MLPLTRVVVYGMSKLNIYCTKDINHDRDVCCVNVIKFSEKTLSAHCLYHSMSFSLSSSMNSREKKQRRRPEDRENEKVNEKVWVSLNTTDRMREQ